jgi:hypothetical protein
MLDGIDKYDKVLLSDLFNKKVLGTDGLGPMRGEAGAPERDSRIPAVLTFDLAGPALEILRSVVEGKGSRKWLNIHPLGPFRSDGEDLLAYERVLLHPHDKALFAGVSDTPIAVADVEPEKLNEWHQTLREVLDGRPKLLTERSFYGLANKGLRDGCLQKANDEDVLRRSGV